MELVTFCAHSQIFISCYKCLTPDIHLTFHLAQNVQYSYYVLYVLLHVCVYWGYCYPYLVLFNILEHPISDKHIPKEN